MRCRQGKATRRKRFKFVTLKIYSFHTFKDIHECQRGNASKAIDHCNIAIVSRDLSRLRTSREIMLTQLITLENDPYDDQVSAKDWNLLFDASDDEDDY